MTRTTKTQRMLGHSNHHSEYFKGQVVKFVEDFLEEHRYAPTDREVQVGCGFEFTKVAQDIINMCIEDGLLARVKYQPRTLHVPKRKRRQNRVNRLRQIIKSKGEGE